MAQTLRCDDGEDGALGFSATCAQVRRLNEPGDDDMPKKVLILDDEPVTTRALALDLRDAGYRVDTARDGEEAVRKLWSRAVLRLQSELERGGSP